MQNFSIVFLMIPSLCLAMMQKKKVFAFQDLFFTQILILSFFLIGKWVFLLAALVQGYLLLDLFLVRRLQIRMQLAHFKWVREIAHLRSSIKDLRPFPFLIAFIAIVMCNLFFFFTEIAPFAFSKWMILSLGISTFSLFRGDYASSHPFLLFRFSTKIQLGSVLKVPSFIAKETDKPHVIILLMESFRAKDINETHAPYFCSLIPEGVYFPNFYANGVKSKLAALSTLQGIPPFLGRQGYHSAYLHNGFLSFEGQREFFSHLGFQTLVGRNELLTLFPEAKGNSWGIEDQYLMDYAIHYLEHRTSPTLLTLATMTNHHPWTPPRSSELKTTKRERFLQTFRYSDHALGDFIKKLKEKKLYDKSIIFILGDHGQPMGEHRNNFLAPNGLYEENVHIPFLILAPKRVIPSRCEAIGSQVDLFPTLVDIFGFHEQSLLRPSEDRMAFFQSSFGKGFLGCRHRRYKYIYSPSTQEEELFDLQSDPEEKHNIAQQQQSLSKKYREAVTHYTFPTMPVQLPFDHTYLNGEMALTDELLETKVKEKQDLQIAHLNESCMLTDRGVISLFAHSPHLEWVNLSGLSDVTDRVFDGFLQPNVKMSRIDLLDCHRLTDQGLTTLFTSCPNLQIFSVCCAHIERFPELVLPRLEILHLQQGNSFADGQLQLFFQSHPHLEQLVLEECPCVNDETLKVLTHLKRLKLVSCHQVTDEGLLFLENQSLILLEIYNCPQISPTTLQTLSERGINILC